MKMFFTVSLNLMLLASVSWAGPSLAPSTDRLAMAEKAIASLILQNSLVREQCRGVLLANGDVLTAAHCALWNGEENVRSSVYLADNPSFGRTGEYELHPTAARGEPKSTPLNSMNDLALIHLSPDDSADEDEFAGSVPLAARPLSMNDRLYIFAGVAEDGNSSLSLSSGWVRLTVEDLHPGALNPKVAELKIQGGYVCAGMSGSPVFRLRDDGSFEIVAILNGGVSDSTRFGRCGTSTIFVTQVSGYASFLKR